MEKQILIFGAGRSSTYLIDYLKEKLPAANWYLTVADNNLQLAEQKIAHSLKSKAISINVEDASLRSHEIKKADIVISLLPPALHILVAKDCLALGKHLLTASYIDDRIHNLAESVKKQGLLFLCEMGLDPGIDHMSAMKAIDQIKCDGGKITSFMSHCGGLVAPETDDNPWHYKISWNSANVVKAGYTGADFRIGHKTLHRSYQDLFFNCDEVDIPELGKLSYYPNRDSLSYMPTYHLEHAETFIRTTLRHPEFVKGWYAIVSAGLTEDKKIIDTSRLTFREWSKTIKPFISEENEKQFEFLGLFDDSIVPAHAHTSADILQYLLDNKLMLRPGDKDMVVMLHQIKYMVDNREYLLNSSLIVKGNDEVYTAMAKTVGLPLGIAAKLILEGKISLTGIHIPVSKEIYTPVLGELKKEGIAFTDTIA